MIRKRPDSDRDMKPVGRIRLQRLLIYSVLLILVLSYAGAKQQIKTEKARQKVERLKKLEEEKKEQEQKETGEHKKKAGTEAGEGTGSVPASGAAESAEEGFIMNQEEMWCLVLTNETHPVPEEYQLILAEIPGTGETVDERIREPLMQMLDAAAQQGMPLAVCSGYRTKEKQTELFQMEVQGYLDQGEDIETANARAKQSVSVPESGEHRLGLAVDIYSENYPVLDEGFGDTPEGLWLREHAPEYGFILRYDRGKEDSTGILYEPWHFRYVGVGAAQYMTQRGLSMEEFYIQESLYE